MFTHASNSNYYFPQYSEFSDAQGNATVSNPPVGQQSAIEVESQYYTTYNDGSTQDAQTQPSAYSGYIHYEPPSYTWPQPIEQRAWDGMSTDIHPPEYTYTKRYPEQTEQEARDFEQVEPPQHHFEGLNAAQIEVPAVPIVCGGFDQPKIAEYQLDGAMKPPFSYITLIVSAMMSNKEKRATLSEIYSWIMNHFAYYRKNTKRWQNSVRHALSFNDCFTKVPRPPGETGKGAYWTLHEGATGMFENGSSIRRCRKFVDEQRVRPRSGRSRRRKVQESGEEKERAPQGDAGHPSPTNQPAEPPQRQA
ncbi:unnamed protein product [Mesocestoides corti]|uniref:Fork-head domain-containing protein n=1 Tax=Mesocestoides corti TaxID=53468 RepID=A0A0R3UJP7_MESCO|nr:unnamed protein product [Mesocestoides corti]